MAVALGIVGFGIMGERLLRAALAHDPAVLRVSGVWDPAPEAAGRLAAIAPDVPMLASPDAVIAGCEALYIASPPAAHIAHAESAFAAGRAVFLEKPLAADLAEARRFVAAAEAAGARAAVNFPMASSPAVAQFSAWRQELGAPRTLSIQLAFATWPRGWQLGAAGWLAKRAEGGFTREVLSHFLFLTRRQLGPMTLESSSASYPEGDGAETAIRARLSAGGITAEIAGGVGITEADEHNEWRLTCEAGAIRLRDWSYAEKQAVDIGWHAAPDALPNEKLRPLVLKGQLDKVAALTRGEAQDLATLREALEVQEIVEAILGGLIPMRRRALLFGLVAAAPALAQPRLAAVTPEEPAGAALVARLREGGLVLFFRHADTIGEPCDRSFRIGDRAGQRGISANGRAQAARIGDGLRELGIPVQLPVLAGPVYRARDTAEAAFGAAQVVVTDRLLADDFAGPRLAWVLAEHRRLFTERVPAGLNRVLVGHRTPAIMVIGDAVAGRAFPEGAALVIEPLGEDLRLLGILAPAALPGAGFHACQ